MHRLFFYTLLTKGIILLKNCKYFYNNIINISKIVIAAGLYNIKTFFVEHSLMLSNLTSKPSTISYQLHGKRKQQTISINANMIKNWIWNPLDKLAHELLPTLFDFLTPKWKKNNISFSYTWRIRHKFLIYDNFEAFTNAIMYDTHKGIYLPLTIHIKFDILSTHLINEVFFRLYRLPINLYRRRYRPAFDDIVTFI